MKQKIESLRKQFAGDDRVMVAYSGGVDSTLLLYLLAREVGVSVQAVTIKTPYIPEWEVEEALSLSRTLGVEHTVITLPVPESIKSNPADRCYLCKKSLFSRIIEHASQKGCNIVADGTNADDRGDHRPGMRALQELEIRSPLLEAGFTKADIRLLLKEYGLDIWDKPAYACLLTRIPHDVCFDSSMLHVIEKAERYIHQRGLPGTRVRLHDDTARIEIPPKLLDGMIDKEIRSDFVSCLKELGIRYVTLDLEGYRTGSMNKMD